MAGTRDNINEGSSNCPAQIIATVTAHYIIFRSLEALNNVVECQV
jgi:hypothetical protein